MTDHPLYPVPITPWAVPAPRQPRYFPPGTLLPMQFPSLSHFEERVGRVYRHAIEVEGLSGKTVTGYREATKRFVLYLRESGTVESFLRGDVHAQMRVLEGWIAWTRGRGANHTTTNHYWRCLHAVCARISRADAVVDPTMYVPTPRPGRPLPRFLTRAALAEVFRFVRNHEWGFGRLERVRNTALIAVMALGGLRLGEVLRLDFGDLDMVEGRIQIRNGKGRNGGKDRVVYMAPALHAALDSYLDARRKRPLTTPRVFASTRGTGAMARVAVRRLCTLISACTGIKVAPHMLRHTCATLMRQAGIPDRLAMEQLGHSSLLLLQRYSHVTNGELQREVGRLQIDADLA